MLRQDTTENAGPPHHLELEQSLLALLLLHNEVFETLEKMRPEHFFHPVHGALFSHMVRLLQKGQLVTPLTLTYVMQENVGFQELGGKAYLDYLAELPVFLGQAESYAALLYELFLRRKLIDIGHNLSEKAKRSSGDETNAMEQIEEAEKELFQLAESSQDNQIQPFHFSLAKALDMAQVAFKRESHVVGITTGFVDLDKQLGGLHPSDLVILAARPSMGKTALAMNIAFNAAKAHIKSQGKEGGRVAVFSLEMSSEQLAMRILGQETEIPSDRIRRGAISRDDFPKFIKLSRDLADLPLFVDDTPALSVQAIRNRARRLYRRGGLGLIVIDYVQLIGSGRKGHAAENRVQELSEITRNLKALAKELSLPILALSQLSRAVEQREDKRPQLSDLRESGSIEQDADVVLFLYREEYYEARKKPPENSEKYATWQNNMQGIQNRAEVLISKQRHGPIGTILLHYEGALTKFSNLDTVYTP